jgi:outer membrane protein
MKFLALGAFALASLAASAAAAQSTGQVTHGPALTGICTFHNERMLATSTAGQSLQTGMQRLVTEVQGEMGPYAQAIQTEATALQQGQASIPADQMQSRRQALQQRINEASQLEQTRDAELRYTRGLQLQTIAQTADPIIVAAYQEKGCSILLDRDSVYIVNPTMDITDTVIQRVNAALPSLSFSRSPVPAQPAQ